MNTKLHDLRSPEGARKKAKRVGRGTGSGHGKTSTRGQKGAKARGQGFRLGFEGGQMPLAQRLPKLGGFKNRFKKQFVVLNLSKLNQFKDGQTVGPQVLTAAGIIEQGEMIKILGAGRLRRKLTVRVHALSESARAAIVARGGSVRILPGAGKPAPAPESSSTEKPAAVQTEQEPAAVQTEQEPADKA